MTNSNEKPQSDKFKDLARELDADEDEERFEDKLRRLAKQKPKKEEPGQ